MIAITLGDPSGIGAEIIVRTLGELPVEVRREVRLYGDTGVLERAARLLGVTPAMAFGGVQLIEVTRLDDADIKFGVSSPAGGAAQIAYLEAALAAAKAGELGALVTAPIDKSAAKAAGFQFPGHTELLAERLGAREHAMMFAGPKLNVVLATIHLALRDVPGRLDADTVARAVFLAGDALSRQFGVARPRVGVLGLNPHAGERGLFGDEEARAIAPGIAAGRARLAAAGVNAEVGGPLVPDAAWRDALAGEPGQRWDVLVAMYHDQGLIPVKLVDFEDAVNVTLGLPIARTSPDHGVAHDIAGTGRARHRSFAAAFALARRLGGQARHQ